MTNQLDFSVDYEKVFLSYFQKNPKYLQKIYDGFFVSSEIDSIAVLSKKFFETYKEVPSKDQIKLLVEKSKYSEQIDKGLVDVIFNVDITQYDNEWLKRITESWIKWRNFDKQLINTTKYVKLKEVNPENVDSIINTAISMLSDNGNVNFDNDLGLNFFEENNHIQSESFKIPSGLNFIDNITGGGYDKKSLIVFVGQANVGKSIWLVNTAADFVKMGKNVVFVTMEMAAHKVIKRIGANLLNIQMSEYDSISKDKRFIRRKLETVGKGVMPPGQLFVKEFPTSQASIIDIENYIKDVQNTTDVKIDVIVVDYINIISNYRNPNSDQTYMKIKQISEDLRGMCVKLDMLGVSATQTSKGAWDSTEVKMENIAESAGLAHTADLIYAIIQDEIMHSNWEYWLKVLKIRDGEGKGSKCRFDIDYNYMRLSETGDIIQSNDV